VGKQQVLCVGSLRANCHLQRGETCMHARSLHPGAALETYVTRVCAFLCWLPRDVVNQGAQNPRVVLRSTIEREEKSAAAHLPRKWLDYNVQFHFRSSSSSTPGSATLADQTSSCQVSTLASTWERASLPF
jgi:hypothetical protein